LPCSRTDWITWCAKLCWHRLPTSFSNSSIKSQVAPLPRNSWTNGRHTHTDIYIYYYIYILLCICICIYVYVYVYYNMYIIICIYYIISYHIIL
jgi:hypothetical protein